MLELNFEVQKACQNEALAEATSMLADHPR